jgi:small subunit ribosomal protein S8
MVSTDPIADMLSRIRNAIAASKNEVVMPHSKLKETILEQLKNNRYIESFEVFTAENGFKSIRVVIYSHGANAKISHIQKVSKPGRRVYVGANEIPRVKNGRGIVIISTPRGVMTGFAATKARVGGEVLCEVY